MIYTFYSYKGGAGRSMALANTAEWFYRRGLRVVMVDWDLEAPGLESFFFDAPEDLTRVRSQLGLIDLLLDYQRVYPQLPPEALRGSLDQKVAALRELLPPLTAGLFPIHKPKSESDRGGLWLLPAGWREGDRFSTYALAVQGFDWADFYARFDGEAYFEWLRRQLVEDDFADVVFVDSRTGVTEMGGVCTRQMADVVVTFCVPNVQNLDGVETMVDSFRRPEVIEARRNRALEVIVVPTRIENSEIRLRNEFEKRFRAVFDHSEVVPPALRRLERTFWDLRIPYIPNYGYMERLAVGQDDAASDLVDAYERLCRSLVTLAPAQSPIVTKLGLEAIPETSVTRHVPFGAPLLPPAYVERSGLHESLVGALLSAREARSGWGSIGLTGLPGAGKTTLAVAACHDRRVRRVFVDGILWVSLGKDPDLVASVQRLYFDATGQPAPALIAYPSRGDYIKDALGAALGDRDLLLVIDDVWSAPDLEVFMAGGSRCVRLVTTPDSAILPSGTRPFFVEAMKPDEAVALLGAGLAVPPPPEELSPLVDALCGLALPLSLANRALSDRATKDAQSAADAVSFLGRVITQRGVVGIDNTQRGDTGESVLETLVSMRRLVDPDQWERMQELVIFEPTTPVPMSTIARLWETTGGLDPVATELLCNRLSQVNLVDIDSSGVRLANLLRDYVSHDAQVDTRSLQDRFLSTYRDVFLPDLPGDELYLWKTLRWHLLQAGAEFDFRELLLNFQWMSNKLKYAGIDSLIGDYDAAAGLAPAYARILRLLMLNNEILRGDYTQLAKIIVRGLAGSDDDSLRRLVMQAQGVLPPSYAEVTVPGERPTGVYICYRPSDTANEATTIYERLKNAFGNQVYKDLATIAPGADFEQAIEVMVERCGTMLVVIGNTFLAAPAHAERTFREIEVALARDLRIIPVLTQGQTLASADMAPSSIAPLFRRTAMEVSRTSEGYDLDRIIEVLKPIVEPFPHVSIVREAEPIVYRSRRLSFFEDLVVIGSLWVPRYVVLLLALVVVVGAILLSANLILNH